MNSNINTLCVFTPATRKNIKQLIEFAERNPLPLNLVREMSEKKVPPIGDDPRRVCMVPPTMKLVFSFEQQPPGLCRHMSMSVNGGAQPPELHQIYPILEMFKFEHQIRDGQPGLEFYLEDFGEGKAVNFLEIMEDKRTISRVSAHLPKS